MLPVANTAGMIEHLRLISQATAKDRQALVIVDRAGWHMTKAIRCFSNVTLLPLPPYSPELNPVEQLWQQIKQRFLSNTTFQNYDDIIERSCQAWNEILSEMVLLKICVVGSGVFWFSCFLNFVLHKHFTFAMRVYTLWE
ncbi:hypothetical protein BSPWISOXPB_9283 [uncultured Gammaproteobacteria bacterium]|nr:hypothetical protein BSPWISOXPB_9283 [uncultured Gammaproteobacteria bacterium]